MKISCVDVDDEYLSSVERDFLMGYEIGPFECEEIWRLMDHIWVQCGCEDSNMSSDNIARFYSHPIWLLNGVFTECNHESKLHREFISKWIHKLHPSLIVDFGGGFGSLGRKIAAYCPDSIVKIIEPYPSCLAIGLSQSIPNLSYAPELPGNSDVVISQDVLEHVVDPLKVFSELLQATKVGGYLVTANCFHPVMKCHLPEVLHYRYTFRFVVAPLGCNYVGTIPGVQHAQIFRRNSKSPNWARARNLERVSKLIFPVLEKLLLFIKSLRFS